MPVKIAHIVNIYFSANDKDAMRIQEITLESMCRAKERAGDVVEVELLSSQFVEDRQVVPGFMKLTKDLERSVQDNLRCEDKRKLPYIHDILERAWKSSTAEYIIYTNIDIAVYPDFYQFIDKSIRDGIDGLAINRAQIPRYLHGQDILYDLSLDQLFCVTNRIPHPGIDCVMFRRENFPLWKPADICIGYPPVGQYLMDNTEYHAKCFVWFRDACRTFHIGIDDQKNTVWRKFRANSIWVKNFREFNKNRIYRQHYNRRHRITRFKKILQRLRWLLSSFSAKFLQQVRAQY